MKKLICFMLAFALVSGTVTAGAAAEINLQPAEQSYFFATTQIHDMDCDGLVFAGVCAGKIVVSRDFENWTFANTALPDVSVVTRLGGEFEAIGKGCTLKSSDGIQWRKYENSLTLPIDKFMKNEAGMVAFCLDYDTGAAGTYVSADGITFQKVDNIPDGGTMHVVNGKFVIESREYMAGIYVSDNGVNFTKIDAPGYELTYYGGAYQVMEYITENVGYNRLWTSSDLKGWQSEKVDYESVYPHNSLFITAGGAEYAYQMNGNILVLDGGVWKHSGQIFASASTMQNICFFFNQTDKGLLAWSNYGVCVHLSSDGAQRTYDGNQRRIAYLFVENDTFYAVTNLIYESGDHPMVYRSQDGLNWTRDQDYRYQVGQQHLMLKGSNGKSTLESEFIERGSFAGRDGNPVITAALTDENGKTSKVAYEDATYDYVQIQSGDGFFLMNRGGNDGSFYSPDGITRYSCPDGLINSKVMVRTNILQDILDVYDIRALRESHLPAAVKVMLNGEYLSFTTNPVIDSDKIWVPVRFLFESAGAAVEWSGKGVEIRYQGKEITVNINDRYATVDGVRKELDTPVRLINGKTLAPLSFVSEECGFTVNYDEHTQTAVITTP